MSPLNRLMQHRQLSQADAKLNIWSYVDSTPAATFNYFVLPNAGGKYLLCAPFKTGKRDLIPVVLVEASAFLNDGLPDKFVSILECAKIAPFDAIAVLSFEAHVQFKTFDSDLHQATLIVFPIYRCEIKGGESPDLIRVIRRDFLPSLDWDRPPHPTVRAAFEISRSGVRSRTSEVLMTSLADVLSILRQMEGRCLSWLRVENWREEELMITFKEDCSWGFILPNNREVTMNNISDAICRLEEFCIT